MHIASDILRCLSGHHPVAFGDEIIHHTFKSVSWRSWYEDGGGIWIDLHNYCVFVVGDATRYITHWEFDSITKHPSVDRFMLLHT